MKPIGCLLLLFTAFFSSCLSSDEEPSTEDSLLEAEIKRLEADPQMVGMELLQPAYDVLSELYNMPLVWGLQEVTSDEVFAPRNGVDWDDSGVWAELNSHSWGEGHALVGNTWDMLLQGVSEVLNAQKVILKATPTPPIEALAAESEALKALFYFHLIDLFGQIPARDVNGQLVAYDRSRGTALAIQLLEGNLDALPAKSSFPGTQALFRINKWAARGILARLYLNEKTYTGAGSFSESSLDKVILYCNEIINSGEYELADNYWGIFGLGNAANTSASDEAILTTRQFNTTQFAVQVLDPAQFAGAWGGFATLAEFYHSFGPGDPRFLGPRITVANANLGFNAGYQLDNHGDTILLFDGAPLFYAVDIDPDGASRQQGARPVKYEPAAAPGGIAPDNLWVALRLGEVYLMRAEAAFRKGSESEALEILNELREKRGAAQLSAVNEDSIMAEYGFELWWEGHRRTQLIRFGKFNRELSIRPTGSEAFYQLFPIPQKALDANPALRQNPGY